MTRRPTVEAFLAQYGPNPMILPDCLIVGSNEDDLRTVFALIVERGWEVVDGAEVLHRAPGEPINEEGYSITLGVRPVPGLHINFFTGSLAVDFDIDLRELTAPGIFDALLDFLAEVGTATGKDVIVGVEMDADDVVLRWTAASGEFTLVETAYPE